MRACEVKNDNAILILSQKTGLSYLGKIIVSFVSESGCYEE